MSNGRNLHSSDLTSLNRSICSDLIEINNDLAATAQFESTNDVYYYTTYTTAYDHAAVTTGVLNRAY